VSNAFTLLGVTNIVTAMMALPLPLLQQRLMMFPAQKLFKPFSLKMMKKLRPSQRKLMPLRQMIMCGAKARSLQQELSKVMSVCLQEV
jgi:hypothetical protein